MIFDTSSGVREEEEELVIAVLVNVYNHPKGLKLMSSLMSFHCKKRKKIINCGIQIHKPLFHVCNFLCFER
jgi:hypothetical protein